MLELHPLLISVVACLGSRSDLDDLMVANGIRLRVAPDEVLLVSGPGEAEELVAFASAQLGEEALVVDQTDAFAGWTLRGEDAHEAFRRLSAIPLPTGPMSIQQGLVAHVPSKTIAANGTIHLLVTATLSHHLSQRVRDACADLDLRETPADAFEPAAIMESTA